MKVSLHACLSHFELLTKTKRLKEQISFFMLVLDTK